MGKNVVYSEPLGVLNLFASHAKADKPQARTAPKPKEKVSLQSFLNAVDELHNAQHGCMGYRVDPRS